MTGGDYQWHRSLYDGAMQGLEIGYRGINSRLMLISSIPKLFLTHKMELVPSNDSDTYARDRNDRF